MYTLRRAAAGTLAAALVAAGARRAGALMTDGAIAATFVGGTVVAGTGFRGGAALVAFFASSSLLGRLPRSGDIGEQRRGNERDAVQVLANGGVATLLALAQTIAPPSAQLWTAYGGAVAAAAADTWATEIGSRWGGAPRSIVTFRSVAPGASGGITIAGLGASVAGALAIAAVLGPDRATNSAPHIIAVTLGGLAGSLTDSLLGATLQEVRWCDACRKETEALVHQCGATTYPLRGQPWCTNDTVNLLATIVGALTAQTIASRLLHPARHASAH